MEHFRRMGWSAAGLLPFNPSKVRFPELITNTEPCRPQTPNTITPFPNTILNRSPNDAIAMQTGNRALLDIIKSNQNTPAKQSVTQLTTSAERLFARATIFERGMNDIRETLSKRERQASGKRSAIKGKHIMIRPEILSEIRGHEDTIAAKKKKVGRKGKRKATAVEKHSDTDSGISVVDCTVVGVEQDNA